MKKKPTTTLKRRPTSYRFTKKRFVTLVTQLTEVVNNNRFGGYVNMSGVEIAVEMIDAIVKIKRKQLRGEL